MWAPFVQFKSRFLLTWVMKSWNCWVDKIQMRIQNVFCHIAKISAHAKIIMQFFANWWATTCNLLMTCRGVALSVCSNNVHIVIKTDWSDKKNFKKSSASGKLKVQPNVHVIIKSNCQSVYGRLKYLYRSNLSALFISYFYQWWSW